MTTEQKRGRLTPTASASATQAKSGKLAASSREPAQFRYLLAPWVAERRADGWFIARSWTSSCGEKPRWDGPFAFPQDACIAIARYLCAELSNRHQAKARFNLIKSNDALFGLPPLPDLSTKSKRGGKP